MTARYTARPLTREEAAEVLQELQQALGALNEERGAPMDLKGFLRKEAETALITALAVFETDDGTTS